MALKRKSVVRMIQKLGSVRLEIWVTQYLCSGDFTSEIEVPYVAKQRSARQLKDLQTARPKVEPHVYKDKRCGEKSSVDCWWWRFVVSWTVVFKVFPWYDHDISMTIFPCYSCDIPMILLWSSHNISMMLPWYSYDIPTIFLWSSLLQFCWNCQKLWLTEMVSVVVSVTKSSLMVKKSVGMMLDC